MLIEDLNANITRMPQSSIKDKADILQRRHAVLALVATAFEAAWPFTSVAVHAQNTPASRLLVVGTFNDIPQLNIEDDVMVIQTSGWSQVGIGQAHYIYDKNLTQNYLQNHQNTASMTKNRRGFRLAANPISLEMVGGLTSSSDNSRALQSGIDHLAEMGGGILSIPGGTFIFRNTIRMRSGVDIVGYGSSSSILNYRGTFAAVDAFGSANERIVFHLRDLCLLGTGSAASAIAIKLAWNQRSLPLLERLRISDFGHYGILFAGNNWLLSFRDIEIHDCGKLAIGSSAIARLRAATDIQSLADIKFQGLVIESCGGVRSSGGAISFPATEVNPTQGLWIDGATIEGNFGSSECSFDHADMVTIGQSYFEIARAGTVSRSAIEISNSNLNLTNCRMASDPGNKLGNSIIAKGKTTLNLNGNIWDTDFRNADVLLISGATAQGIDTQKVGPEKMRIKKSQELQIQ